MGLSSGKNMQAVKHTFKITLKLQNSTIKSCKVQIKPVQTQFVVEVTP